MHAGARGVRQHLELVPVASLGGAPGPGFGVWNACSSSQTRCHFCSIVCGSYVSNSSSGDKTGLRWRPWEVGAALAAVPPALSKLPLHGLQRTNVTGRATTVRGAAR